MKHYSLIDKVYRMDNLRAAYRAVRANNGGALGIDGETVDASARTWKPGWQRFIRSSDQDLTNQVRCGG